MKIISLPKRIDPKLGTSLIQLLDILDELNQHIDNSEDELIIDMTPCELVTPLIATPIAALKNRFSKLDKNVSIHCNPGVPFATYSKTIHFPDGFLPENIKDNEYEKALKSYANKTYLPILNFPATKSLKTNSMRESILQALHNLLYQQLHINANFRDGISYLITELVNNIADHSESERGFIFGQYYPYGKFLELCIVDDGLGILGSYHKHSILGFTSDAQAINGAVSGISTKIEVGGRGFGIYTSLKMLVNGMGGSFLLVSGNAHLIRNPTLNDLNQVPDSMRWAGTLVVLRIPFTQKHFNYVEYLE